MKKYRVTSKGPIDRNPPGTDVTEVYSAKKMAALVEDGYIEEVKPKRKAAAKKGGE